MKHAQLSSLSAATLRWLMCASITFCSLGVCAQQTQTTDNPQTITGSGKRGYIAGWNSSTQLTDSIIFQNNGLIGVGTIHPSTNLDVVGGINSSTGYNLGGQPFAFGSSPNANAFFGFAGNVTMSGGNNLGAGQFALGSNTQGQSNVATGFEALQNNNTGSDNSATGFSALWANTAGTANTANGFNAIFNNTTGNYNTGVGYKALSNNVTGNYNTALGAQAGPESQFNTFTNATAIGAFAAVNQSNALVLGCTIGANSCPGTVSVGIGITTPTNILTIAPTLGPAISDGWDTYSSRRFKTNIETLHDALDKVEQLRGVSYDLKANGKHEIGVIAEEVGTVVPEVVSWDRNGKDAQGVDYSRLTALLIQATKEQQSLIQKQQEQLQAQQAQIARLTSQVKAIQASVRTNGRSDSTIRTVSSDRPYRQ